MKKNFIKVWGNTAFVVLATLIIFLWVGEVSALFWLSCALLMLLVRERYYLYVLWNWIAHHQETPLPPASGIWDTLFAHLYRQHQAALRQQAHLAKVLNDFRYAAQALPDGVVTLNEQNQIGWCNTQASEHLGLVIPNDAGRNIVNLLRFPNFLSYLDQGHWDAPVLVHTRMPHSADDRLVSLQLVAYGTGQKLLLSRDVTKIERLETMRRDFIANVSHELKTPLTVFSGFLETIREMPLAPEQQKQYLAVMAEQSQRMERLVSDLLTLSALEANDQMANERIAMNGLLSKIEAITHQLSGGAHQLVFEIEPELDLIGVESEIFSALSNLVSNAVRYTPAGGRVTITWKSGAIDDSQATGAQFSVRDTGIGIEAQHLPRLTERFYRVDHGRSRASGGTGLGLAIVKHVLTRHQAQLMIESTSGQGSCFRAHFPAQRVASRGSVGGLVNPVQPSHAQPTQYNQGDLNQQQTKQG